jgi:hypothetical protein
MNTRTLKKRVFYIIADAVDHINLHPEEKDVEKKTERLLNLYDATIDRINEHKQLGDKTQLKSYFHKVKTDFNAEMQTILS